MNNHFCKDKLANQWREKFNYSFDGFSPMPSEVLAAFLEKIDTTQEFEETYDELLTENGTLKLGEIEFRYLNSENGDMILAVERAIKGGEFDGQCGFFQGFLNARKMEDDICMIFALTVQQPIPLGIK